MVIRRIVQVSALAWPFVVAGVLLGLLFVPRDESSEMLIDVPPGFALLDLDGKEVQEVSISEFFDLDLENPTMLVMGGGGIDQDIILLCIGVGQDDQGNTVVYKAEEILQSGDGGHTTNYRVDIGKGSIAINAEAAEVYWGIAYLILSVLVSITAYCSWRLAHDHLLGNEEG